MVTFFGFVVGGCLLVQFFFSRLFFDGFCMLRFGYWLLCPLVLLKKRDRIRLKRKNKGYSGYNPCRDAARNQ